MSPRRGPRQPQSQTAAGRVRLTNTPPDYDGMCPLFSFEHIVKWDCAEADRAHLLERLIRMGGYKWREINQYDHDSLGFEPIQLARFRPSVRAATPKGFSKLQAGHYSQKGRFAGYRIDNIFYVLLIDPDHNEF